jgi:hypothetical protein
MPYVGDLVALVVCRGANLKYRLARRPQPSAQNKSNLLPGTMSSVVRWDQPIQGQFGQVDEKNIRYMNPENAIFACVRVDAASKDNQCVKMAHRILLESTAVASSAS